MGRTVAEAEFRKQVGDDVVVVAGIEGDVVAARFENGADYVKRPIAVKGSDLYRDDALDVTEALPEIDRKHQAADRWLEQKTMSRDAVVTYLTDLLWPGLSGATVRRS